MEYCTGIAKFYNDSMVNFAFSYGYTECTVSITIYKRLLLYVNDYIMLIIIYSITDTRLPLTAFSLTVVLPLFLSLFLVVVLPCSGLCVKRLDVYLGQLSYALLFVDATVPKFKITLQMNCRCNVSYIWFSQLCSNSLIGNSSILCCLILINCNDWIRFFFAGYNWT